VPRTNLQLLTDSLRLAGIVGEIETPSNEDAQDALRRLNDMVLGWKRHKGVDLGFYPQTSLAAEIPIDDEYFEAVTLNLAKRIAQHWGVNLGMDVSVQAESSWRSILAEFIAPEPADASHFPGAGGRRWNIETD
jgi:hypothetical protein